MKKEILLILLFILNTTGGFSQKEPMETDIEEIKAKGREAIVQMAFDQIKEKKPEWEILPQDYEITVWANKKEVIVKFRRLIRYVPKGKHYTYNFSIVIFSKEAPFFNTWYKNNFFVPTQEQKDTIAYLTELIGLPYQHMDNSISEDEENYYVSMTSKTAFSHHIINKKTGERLEPLEGTYAVLPPPNYNPLDPESNEKEGDPLFPEPIAEKDPLKEIVD